jgi:hypothetical protein
MSESQGSGTTIPWPALFAAFTAVGGLFYWLIPVVSQRPETKPTSIFSSLGYQNIDARLWQDPLQAAYEHEEGKKRARALTSLVNEEEGVHGLNSAFWRLIHVPHTRAMLLPVMIPGRPFFEDAETRIRSRVAVVSALGAASFVPDDAEHLGFFKVRDWPRIQAGLFIEHQETDAGFLSSFQRWLKSWPAVGQTDKSFTDKGDPLIVPYEWWHKQGNSAECVMVLWLNEDLFSDLPLTRLRRLLDTMFWYLERQEQDLKHTYYYDSERKTLHTEWIDHNPVKKKDIHLSVNIIGPGRSTTLEAMASERIALDIFRSAEPKDRQAFGMEQWETERWARLHGVGLLSAKATADDSLIMHSYHQTLAAPELPEKLRQDALSRVDVRSILNEAPLELRFNRGTATDKELCELLVKELSLRGINPGDPIALVTEWDTYYGRSLPLSFASAAEGGEHPPSDYEPSPDPQTPAKSEWPKWITRFSYLRGIDGKTPDIAPDFHQTKPTQAETATKDLFKPSTPSDQLAPPQGKDQSDYLLRLAADLDRMDNQNPSGQGFRAIGVLGSDVYDKLQIMEALRPRFPRAVFFTTDVDARLDAPSEWRTTHNLIVASPFDLRLKANLRIGRQSVDPRMIPPFRDTHQTALFYATLCALDDPDASVTCRPAPPPLLFEVGRHGARQLTDPFGRQIPDDAPATLRSASTSPPSTTETWPQTPDNVQPRPPKVFEDVHSRSLIGILLAALCGVALFACLRNPVDVWPPRKWCDLPTRLGIEFAIPHVAALFGCLLLLTLFIDWQSKTGVPFALFDGLSLWPTEFLRLLAGLLSLFLLDWAARQIKDSLAKENTTDSISENLQAPWASYKTGFSRSQLVAAVVIACVGSVTSALLMFGRPHVPYRGHASQWADIIIWNFCIVALTLLSCFVADSARRSGKFINEYAEARKREALGDVDELLHLQILGRVTRPVEQSIYYPFFSVAILIVSCGSYFADWGIPLTSGVCAALICALALIGSWYLRRSAKNARRAAVERIKERLLSPGTGDDKLLSERLRLLLAEVQAYGVGPFGSVSQHPVLGALLLPSSGLGIWALLQYLAS